MGVEQVAALGAAEAPVERLHADGAVVLRVEILIHELVDDDGACHCEPKEGQLIEYVVKYERAYK